MTDRTSTSTSSNSEEPPSPDTKSPAEIQLGIVFWKNN